MKKYTEEDVFNKFRHIDDKKEFARFMDKYYDRICAMDLDSVKKHLPIDFRGFNDTYIDDDMIKEIEPTEHYPFTYRGYIRGWFYSKFMAAVVTAFANTKEELWKNMLLQYMYYLDGYKECELALNQFKYIVSCLPDVLFNTQLCTTVEQSKKLVELGLDFSTADAYWQRGGFGFGYKMVKKLTDVGEVNYYPAWTLHRLIALCPIMIVHHQSEHEMSLSVTHNGAYYEDNFTYPTEEIECFDLSQNLYENLIDCIEWLIKENHFNKQYLNESL